MGWCARLGVGVVAAWLLLAALPAQAAPPRVVSVRVASVRRDPATLATLLRLRPGEPYSAERADRDLKRLYATGAFEDVRLELRRVPGGVALLYRCLDRTFLERLAFTDHRFPLQTLRQAVGLEAGRPLDRDRLAAAAERLRALYQGEGYPEVAVRLEVEEIPARRAVAATFHIRPGRPLRLRRVRFEGPLPVAPWRLRWALGLHFGDHLRPAAFDARADALARYLRRRGYLGAKVGPLTLERPPGSRWCRLRVPLEPGVRTRFRVRGNRALSRREVVAAIDPSRRTALDAAGRARMAAAVVAAYRRAGYDRARVEVEPPRPGRPGEQVVVVRCHEGRRRPVAGIEIDTGGGLDPEAVRRVMALARPRSFGRRPWFRSDLFEADRRAIEALLRLSGRYRGRLAVYEAVPGEAGVTIRVRIDPGPVATLAEVALEGARAIPREALLAGVATGGPLKLAEVRDLRRRILKRYRARGFLEAQVSTRLEPLGGGRWRLAIRVREGVAARVGATHLRGLTRTHPEVVRRELAYRRGDPLDPALLARSRQALVRLGLFERVAVEPDPLLAGAAVRDVVVSVDEGKQGEAAWSIGFGSEENLRTAVEISHRNPFGHNRPISFLARLSSLERTLFLSGREPRLFGSHTAAVVNLVQARRRFENFTKTTIGTAALLERELLPRVHGSLGFQYDNASLSDISGEVRVTDADAGRIGLASGIASLFWDRRDNPLDPSRGFLLGTDLQWSTALLLSERDFLKVGLQAAAYLTPRPGWTTAFGLRTGTILPTRGGQIIPIQVRYFLGGPSTLRAFHQDELAGDDPEQLGGISFLLLNLEERFPLYRRLRGVLFSDVGNVFARRDPFSPLAGLRTTAGVGLRIRTPVGPLRLDYGVKLNRRAGESRGELHFSLGQAF